MPEPQEGVMPIRVALFGNIANNFFRLGQVLENDPELEIHLFLPPESDAQSMPENDMSGEGSVLPPWVHRNSDYVLRKSIRQNSSLSALLDTFDLILFSSINVAISFRIQNALKVFLATGNDFTVFPFWKRYLEHVSIMSKKDLKSWTRNFISAVFYQYIMRRGFKNVDLIVPQPIRTMDEAARLMRIKPEKLKSAYFPFAIDTDLFSPTNVEQNMEHILNLEAFERCAFRVFNPSRILLKNYGSFLASGDFKGNDVLVKGFADFVTSNQITDAGLFLIDRDDAQQDDVFALKLLISELGIGQFVHWISRDNFSSFNSEEMKNLYLKSDVIANDFSVGWFGSAALEALSCGKPVLSFINEEYFDQHYSENPFINVNSPHEIRESLTMLYFNKSVRNRIGAASRDWILANHSKSAIRAKYHNQIVMIIESGRLALESNH